MRRGRSRRYYRRLIMQRQASSTAGSQQSRAPRLRWLLYPGLVIVLAIVLAGAVRLVDLSQPLALALWVTGLIAGALILEILATRVRRSSNLTPTLLALAEAVDRAGDAGSLARAVLRWARTHLAAEAGAVLAMSKDRGLEVLAAEVAADQVVPQPMTGQRHAVTAALRSGEPVVVPLAADDPWLAHLAVGLGPGSAGLCVPLLGAEAPVGLLAIVTKRTALPTISTLRSLGETIGPVLAERLATGPISAAAGPAGVTGTSPSEATAPSRDSSRPSQATLSTDRANGNRGVEEAPVPAAERFQTLDVFPLASASAVARFISLLDQLPSVLHTELRSFVQGRAVFSLEVSSLPDMLRGLPSLPGFEAATIDLRDSRIKLHLEEAWPGALANVPTARPAATENAAGRWTPQPVDGKLAAHSATGPARAASPAHGIPSRSEGAYGQGAAPQRLLVAVRPFRTFSAVDRFLHALDTLPEVSDVRVRGFKHGILSLELTCEPAPSYQAVFSRVPGFRCEVLQSTPDLEIEIEEVE